MYDNFISNGWDLTQFEDGPSGQNTQDLLLQAQKLGLSQNTNIDLQALQLKSMGMPAQQTFQQLSEKQQAFNQESRTASLDSPILPLQVSQIQLQNRKQRQFADFARDDSYIQQAQPVSRMERPSMTS